MSRRSADPLSGTRRPGLKTTGLRVRAGGCGRAIGGEVARAAYSRTDAVSDLMLAVLNTVILRPCLGGSCSCAH